MISNLQGLAILDNDGRNRQDSVANELETIYWRRYEAENYFITPDVLRKYVADQYSHLPLFNAFADETEEILSTLILERVFLNENEDFQTWKAAAAQAAQLLWIAKTERIKLSDFAEEFFRRLASRLGHPMLLKKGEFHRLIDWVDRKTINVEVSSKLDRLKQLFESARGPEEVEEIDK